MSRALGAEVPAAVRRLLQDDPQERVGETILLLTAGEDGWPHLAMVSVGELVVTGPDRLALALWPASTAAANLARNPRATLGAVTEGRSLLLRCRADAGHELTVPGGQRLRAFTLQVTAASEDVAPYADLLAGVSFRLHDPPSAIGRWRATRTALHAATNKGAH